MTVAQAATMLNFIGAAIDEAPTERSHPGGAALRRPVISINGERFKVLSASVDGEGEPGGPVLVILSGNDKRAALTFTPKRGPTAEFWLEVLP